SGLPGVTVVVVENSGSASEEARVRELGRRHGWEVLTVPNRGFGAGMNAGVARARAAGAAAHLLLNPDVEADAGTVLALLAHAAAEPAALVTPSVSTPTGRSAFAVGSLDLRTGLTRTRAPLDPTHATWVSGACLAVPDALWSRMGGLAEDYFMYWEDLDLSA